MQPFDKKSKSKSKSKAIETLQPAPTGERYCITGNCIRKENIDTVKVKNISDTTGIAKKL